MESLLSRSCRITGTLHLQPILAMLWFSSCLESPRLTMSSQFLKWGLFAVRDVNGKYISIRDIAAGSFRGNSVTKRARFPSPIDMKNVYDFHFSIDAAFREAASLHNPRVVPLLRRVLANTPGKGIEPGRCDYPFVLFFSFMCLHFH